jgi:hypothetical protein
MNRQLSAIGLAALKGCVELLMIMPLLILLVVSLFSVEASRLLWLVTIPVYYAAGCAAYRYLPIGRWYRLLAVVLLLGAAGAYGVSGTTVDFIFMVPVGCLAVYRGARMVDTAWNRMFPVSFYIIGLIVYFISSVFMQFMPAFEAYMPLLTGCGLLALAITLLAANQFTMKLETLSGDKEPVLARGVMWQNRILVAAALVIIVIVVFFRKIQAFFVWMKEQLIAWIIALFSHTGEQPPEGIEPAKPSLPPGLEKAGPPNPWLQLLEQVFMFLVGAAVVIGLLILLYLAAKRLPRLFKKLYAWLMQVWGSNNQRSRAIGYEDNVESLMDWKTLPGDLTDRFRHWMAERFAQRAKWESMNNPERVRYLYKQWVRFHAKEGYRPQQHLTPLETSRDIERWDEHKKHRGDSDDLVSVYEQVRYGEKLPDEHQVEIIKKIIEGNKQK